MPRRPANRDAIEAWTLPQLERSLPAAGLVTPLSHLLAVINDPDATPERRDKCAIAAAPFCHPRAGEVGKKVKQAAAAKAAGEGTTWADDLDYGDARPRQ